MIETITSIYSPGIKHDGEPTDIEDAHFGDNFPFAGVVDCHSGPKNLGRVVRDITRKIMNTTPIDVPLIHRLLRINKAIDSHYGIEKFGLRAGAVFALAEIGDKSVQVIQGGDCYAVWQLKSGEIGFTPNQYEEYDIQAVVNYAQLMEEYDEQELLVWPEQQEFLVNIRERFANRKYAVLNGDQRVENCWFTSEIPIEDLRAMLFFTDGLITGLSMGENLEALLKRILRMVKNNGLEAPINGARSLQKETLKNSHIQFPEISAVYVTF